MLIKLYSCTSCIMYIAQFKVFENTLNSSFDSQLLKCLVYLNQCTLYSHTRLYNAIYLYITGTLLRT